jgi:digeranylgeranylglycerophospholipid reductase
VAVRLARPAARYYPNRTLAPVEEVDVLVVGGGPAGSTAAFRLAERGHRVVLVEEHPRIGFPVQCAGLVSQRVLDLAGSTAFVRQSVRGATVFGPGMGSVSFLAPEPRAFVIDRAGLDIYLAERAARAGVVIRTSVRFDEIVERSNGRTVVRMTDGSGSTTDLSARLVVGADGVASAVARAFRIRRPVEILPAFEAEFPKSPGDVDRVEVYLGRTFAPGLFGWWIPDGAGGARVGIAADADGTSARVYFGRLLEFLERRFGEPIADPSAYLVSGIPIGNVPKTHAAGAMLVGDAGAQVKPLSGGGIFTGMRCAEILAGVADEALRRNDLSEAFLAEYDRRWRAELGEEFRKALYLRRILTRLTDADLDGIVAAIAGAELSATIVAFGDIDFPTHVARQLLRQSPSLVRLLPKALGAWWSTSSAMRVPELEEDSRRK